MPAVVAKFTCVQSKEWREPNEDWPERPVLCMRRSQFVEELLGEHLNLLNVGEHMPDLFCTLQRWGFRKTLPDVHLFANFLGDEVQQWTEKAASKNEEPAEQSMVHLVSVAGWTTKTGYGKR